MNPRTVVITGATKGLGRATALEFAQAGHLVVGLYSSDDDAAEQLRRDLEPLASRSIVLKHDVGTENAHLWARAEIQEARSLVLINNACAPFTPQPFHVFQWQDFETAWTVALKGSWLCSRAVLRLMTRAGSATIVNVLTAAVHGLPPKGFGAYIVAKHAERGLTLALASEYSARGLRIFSVSPGFMATALTAGWDARLTDAIREASPTSDPPTAAKRIRELVDGAASPARGEDYPV